MISLIKRHRKYTRCAFKCCQHEAKVGWMNKMFALPVIIIFISLCITDRLWNLKIIKLPFVLSYLLLFHTVVFLYFSVIYSIDYAYLYWSAWLPPSLLNISSNIFRFLSEDIFHLAAIHKKFVKV
jgi:hypothetical protein